MAAPVLQEVTTPKRYRFTAEQYYQMAEAGILAPDERVELVNGAIFSLAPPSPEQAYLIVNLHRFMLSHTSEEIRVGVHNPIHLDQYTEPRPSLSLSRWRPNRYAHPAPDDILLVVEVSDAIHDYDRNSKLPLYAAAGIVESWLFDVSTWMLERHTDPRDGIYQRVARARTRPIPRLYDPLGYFPRRG